MTETDPIELLREVTQLVRQVQHDDRTDPGIELFRDLGLKGIDVVRDAIERSDRNSADREARQSARTSADLQQQLYVLRQQLELGEKLFPREEPLEAMKKVRELAKTDGA